jgi:hypothetical protein
MKDQLIILATIASLAGAAGPALADHNSKNGEGWANMPNDIHNTRIETRENGDNESFREFVKFGEGSKTVNRFDTEDNSRSPANKGVSETSENGASRRSRANDETMTGKRSRFENRASATSRMSRGASSARGIASRSRRGRR